MKNKENILFLEIIKELLENKIKNKQKINNIKTSLCKKQRRKR